MVTRQAIKAQSGQDRQNRRKQRKKQSRLSSSHHKSQTFARGYDPILVRNDIQSPITTSWVRQRTNEIDHVCRVCGQAHPIKCGFLKVLVSRQKLNQDARRKDTSLFVVRRVGLDSLELDWSLPSTLLSSRR